MASPPAKKPTGFSLYGDLLDPSAKPSATITGAPVKYAMKASSPSDGDAAATGAAAKKKDASLKFQPVRRAQQPAPGKTKGKGDGKSRAAGWSSSSVAASTPAKPSSGAISADEPVRAKFEDWVGDEEEEVFFDHRPKAPRGGKKRKGKKGGGREEEQEVDWERVYDPARPTVLGAYRGSGEQEAERREWKEWLYAWAEQGRRKRSKTGTGKGVELKGKAGFAPPSGLNFAPPYGMSFAPPPIGSDDRTAGERMDIDDDDDEYQPTLDAPTVPPALSSDIDAATGEDAFARRMRLSGMSHPGNTAPPPLAFAQARAANPAPTLPAAPKPQPPADVLAKLAAAKAKLEDAKAKHEADRAQAVAPATPSAQPLPVTSADNLPPPPPPHPEDATTTSISRAPVLYTTSQPPQPQDDAPPRSKAPGQKGFGARMMAKMGWEKGQGLGANGEGMTTALVAQAEKRKKRADAAGGGWAQPRNMGKIVGGKRKAVEKLGDDDGAFGAMSYVVKLSGMLAGLDVDWEMSENNLMQEIGEEFGGKYGSIERVFIWREAQGGKDEVFVKFTSQLSALRAVNATDGMTFAENAVVARFFDDGKFEGGEYA